MIPVARPERTCENRLYPERKVLPVKSFRAKATLWIPSPLPTTNSGDSARVGETPPKRSALPYREVVAPNAVGVACSGHLELKVAADL